jgi:cytochrome P450
VIRLVPTVSVNGRTATEDVRYRGLDIPAGTRIYMITTAANTDPAVFGTGGFDITATRPAVHLTFGAGVHYCLGAALARAEIAEALRILAGRLRDIEQDGPVPRQPFLGLARPVRLPIRFTA